MKELVRRLNTEYKFGLTEEEIEVVAKQSWGQAFVLTYREVSLQSRRGAQA